MKPKNAETHDKAKAKRRNTKAAGDAKKFRGKCRDKKCRGNVQNKKDLENSEAET